MRKKDYKDKYFVISCPEGGIIFDSSKIDVFTGFNKIIKKEPENPIRFIAKVVGFEDKNASMRDWGKNWRDL